MLTQELLKHHLHYNPETGIFTRRVASSNSVHVGDVAGFKTDTGYLRISLLNREFRAHRLAWMYMYGDFPANDIDHVNGVRTDNRIANLREATRGENMFNTVASPKNKCGFKNVYWHKQRSKWCASCKVRGKKYSLGLHDTAEAAYAAYVEFAKQMHGEFFTTRQE